MSARLSRRLPSVAVAVNTITIRHYNGGGDLTVLCDLDQRRCGRFRHADHTARRRLLVACLRATGVYAINPMA